MLETEIIDCRAGDLELLFRLMPKLRREACIAHETVYQRTVARVAILVELCLAATLAERELMGGKSLVCYGR
jgi:hypothetical protein